MYIRDAATLHASRGSRSGTRARVIQRSDGLRRIVSGEELRLKLRKPGRTPKPQPNPEDQKPVNKTYRQPATTRANASYGYPGQAAIPQYRQTDIPQYRQSPYSEWVEYTKGPQEPFAGRPYYLNVRTGETYWASDAPQATAPLYPGYQSPTDVYNQMPSTQHTGLQIQTQYTTQARWDWGTY